MRIEMLIGWGVVVLAGEPEPEQPSVRRYLLTRGGAGGHPATRVRTAGPAQPRFPLQP